MRPQLGRDGEPLEWVWQAQIVRVLRLHGWKVYYIPDSRRAGSDGYPDLHAVHSQKHLQLFAELKRHDGTVSPKQADWLDTLESTGNATYLWICDKNYCPPTVWEEVCRIAHDGPGEQDATRWGNSKQSATLTRGRAG